MTDPGLEVSGDRDPDLIHVKGKLQDDSTYNYHDCAVVVFLSAAYSVRFHGKRVE